MDIQPIKIRSTVINSNQFMHGTNQFIQQLGPLAFEGQFDLTAYLKMFIDQYVEEYGLGPKTFINLTAASTNSVLVPVLLQSLLIPANTVQPGDVVDLNVKLDKTGVNTGVGLIYANTSNSLVGATTLGSTALLAGISNFNLVTRTLSITSNAQNTSLFSALDQVPYEYQSLQQSFDVTVDWTVDQYIIVGGYTGNASTTIESQMLMVKRYRQ